MAIADGLGIVRQLQDWLPHVASDNERNQGSQHQNGTDQRKNFHSTLIVVAETGLTVD